MKDIYKFVVVKDFKIGIFIVGINFFFFLFIGVELFVFDNFWFIYLVEFE